MSSFPSNPPKIIKTPTLRPQSTSAYTLLISTLSSVLFSTVNSPDTSQPSLNQATSIVISTMTLASTNQPIDWNRVIENTTIKITAILTLIVLAQRIK